jgi:hypothetical protein
VQRSGTERYGYSVRRRFRPYSDLMNRAVTQSSSLLISGSTALMITMTNALNGDKITGTKLRETNSIVLRSTGIAVTFIYELKVLRLRRVGSGHRSVECERASSTPSILYSKSCTVPLLRSLLRSRRRTHTTQWQFHWVGMFDEASTVRVDALIEGTRSLDEQMG